MELELGTPAPLIDQPAQGLRNVPGTGLFRRNGIRLRLRNHGGIVREGREEMTGLMRSMSVPGDIAFDIDLMIGEALSNVMKYCRYTPDVLFYAVVLERQIVVTLVYDTELFDTGRPDPGPLAERGRGIPIIRTFCEMGGGKAEFRFRSKWQLGMRSYVPHRLAVVLIKKW